MTLQEFETKIQDIRARNGWKIEIQCCGIWLITVLDKETNEVLATTGSSGLAILPEILEMPFDQPPWVG